MLSNLFFLKIYLFLVISKKTRHRAWSYVTSPEPRRRLPAFFFLSFCKLASMICSRLMVAHVIRYIRWLPATPPSHSSPFLYFSDLQRPESPSPLPSRPVLLLQLQDKDTSDSKHLALLRRRPPRSSTTSSRLSQHQSSQPWQTWRVTRQGLSCFCGSSLLLLLLLLPPLVSVFSTSVFFPL